jgi:hypothetical protein
MHVDDFIDSYRTDAYASFVLHHFRLPSTVKEKFNAFVADYKLFCSYHGKRYRCTGASRLGDVWLSSDFQRKTGYEHRVDVDECSDWGAEA